LPRRFRLLSRRSGLALPIPGPSWKSS